MMTAKEFHEKMMIPSRVRPARSYETNQIPLPTPVKHNQDVEPNETDYEKSIRLIEEQEAQIESEKRVAQEIAELFERSIKSIEEEEAQIEAGNRLVQEVAKELKEKKEKRKDELY